MIKSQERNHELHGPFHNQLEKADDGFSVVADYFGRGVFNKVSIASPVKPAVPASLPIRVAAKPVEKPVERAVERPEPRVAESSYQKPVVREESVPRNVPVASKVADTISRYGF